MKYFLYISVTISVALALVLSFSETSAAFFGTYGDIGCDAASAAAGTCGQSGPIGGEIRVAECLKFSFPTIPSTIAPGSLFDLTLTEPGLTVTHTGENVPLTKIIKLPVQEQATLLQKMYFSNPVLYKRCLAGNVMPPPVSIKTKEGYVALSSKVLPQPAGKTYPGYVTHDFNLHDSYTNHFSPQLYSDLTLTPPFSFDDKTDLQKINAEDAIIKYIDENKKLTVRLGIPEDLKHVEVDIPATNCVRLSGNGPRKIVFQRGDGWNVGISDFLWMTSTIRDKFLETSPFKEYASQLSFYVDLKKLPQKYGREGYMGSYGVGDMNSIVMQNLSSCGDDALEYLFLFSDSKKSLAWAEVEIGSGVAIPGHLSYLNIEKLTAPYDISIVAIHETGHAIANLFDEYYSSDQSGMVFGRNCTVDPYSDYKNSTDNKLYGAVGETGCGYEHPANLGDAYSYVRPSRFSIMKSGEESDRFNVIDCGYIVDAILHNRITYTKTFAEKYWPECMKMDGIMKDGIPTWSEKKPVISNKIPEVVSAGETISIEAAGLTSNGNSVKFTPVSLSSAVDGNRLTASVAQGFEFVQDDGDIRIDQKDIDDVIANGEQTLIGNDLVVYGDMSTLKKVTAPNPYNNLKSTNNGTKLSFKVPADLTPGVYKLKVGALNSDWSNEVQLTVTAASATSTDQTGKNRTATSTPMPIPSPAAQSFTSVVNNSNLPTLVKRIMIGMANSAARIISPIYNPAAPLASPSPSVRASTTNLATATPLPIPTSTAPTISNTPSPKPSAAPSARVCASGYSWDGTICRRILFTPSPSSSPLPSPTFSLTPSASPTPSPTARPTTAPSASASPFPTSSLTPIPSATPRSSAPPSPSPTIAPSTSPLPTSFPTIFPSPSPSSSPSPTLSPNPSASITPTPTVISSVSPSPSPSTSPHPSSSPSAKIGEYSLASIFEAWVWFIKGL